MEKITKNSTLEQILKIKGSSEALHKNGVPCLTCPMAQYEMSSLKIGEIAKMYGLKLDKILKELNEKGSAALPKTKKSKS